MPKKPSMTTLVKKLDTIFSEYIRRRYAKDDIAECVTCGKKAHWKEMQAGHFISRKHRSTRWHPDNVQVQCVGCNVFKYGQQYLFGVYLGKEKADELLKLSREIVKHKDFEIVEMIEHYKSLLNELK